MSPQYGHMIWSADRLIWQVSIDHNMMSYIKKVHGKPRLHVSVNLLFGVWLPWCVTAPSLLSYTPTRNTAGHDNIRKSIHGAPLGGLSGCRSSATNAVTQNDHNLCFRIKTALIISLKTIRQPCLCS